MTAAAVTPDDLAALVAEADTARGLYEVARRRYDAATLAVARARCFDTVRVIPSTIRSTIILCALPKGHAGEHEAATR